MSKNDILEYAKKQAKRTEYEMERTIQRNKEEYEEYFTKKLVGKRFRTLHGEYWTGTIVEIKLMCMFDESYDDNVIEEIIAFPKAIVSWDMPGAVNRSWIGIDGIELIDE